MKHFLLFTFLLSLTSLKVQASPEEDAVGQFLRDALMNHYANWTEENNLDPTPVDTTYPVNVGYSNSTDNLTGIFTNHVVWGLSLPKNTGAPIVNLTDSYLEVSYASFGLRIGGEYFVNGTIRSNVTVEGRGSWSVEIAGLGFFIHRFAYKNFEITRDGYINVTNADAFSYVDPVVAPPLSEMISHIDGLSAGGYEAEVSVTLMENFFSYNPEVFCTRRNPIVRYADEFLTMVLLSTPISEMGTPTKDTRPDLNPQFSVNQKEVNCLPPLRQRED